MKSLFKIALLIFAVLFASCGEQKNPDKVKTSNQPDTTTLVPVQQGTAGDITVMLYSTQKDLRHGQGSFVIGFHEVKSGEPVRVTNVNLETSMQSEGKTIKGETKAEPTDETGIYNVEYNFPEKGMWYININYNDSLKVQLILYVI